MLNLSAVSVNPGATAVISTTAVEDGSPASSFLLLFLSMNAVTLARPGLSKLRNVTVACPFSVVACVTVMFESLGPKVPLSVANVTMTPSGTMLPSTSRTVAVIWLALLPSAGMLTGLASATTRAGSLALRKILVLADKPSAITSAKMLAEPALTPAVKVHVAMPFAVATLVGLT
jgi:hypothetical protein